MGKFYKFLFTFLAVGMIFPTVPLLTIAGGTLLAFGAFSATRKAIAAAIRSNREAEAVSPSQARSRGRAEVQSQARDVRKSYFSDGELDSVKLPEGMEATSRGRNSAGEAFWRISMKGMPAGIGILAYANGSRRRGFADFITNLPESERRKAKAFLDEKGFPDAISTIRGREGREFSVRLPDASVMRDLMNHIYSPKEMTVSRTTRTVNRYVVFDAGSYEEALESVKRGKVSPTEAFVQTDLSVDGKLVRDGKVEDPLPAIDSLPLGAFVIDAVSPSQQTATVIAGGRSDEEYHANALSEFDNPETVKTAGVEGVVTYARNGERASRTLDLPMPLLTESGREVRNIPMVSPDELFLKNGNAGLVFNFKNSSQLDAFLADGIVPEGTSLSLERDMRSAGGDSLYSVTVPLDAALFKSLTSAGAVAGALSASGEKYGLKPDQATASVLAWELANRGSSNVYVSSDLSLNRKGVLVNGCPLDDVIEAVAQGGIFERLNQRQRADWMSQASQIVSANIFVDTKNKNLVVESQVRKSNGDLAYKRQEKPLTDRQIAAIAPMGRISGVVAKDFIMASNPSFFPVYSGKASVSNPLNILTRQSPAVKKEGVAKDIARDVVKARRTPSVRVPKSPHFS